MIKLLENSELLRRIELSKKRLSSKEYCYPEIFKNDNDWAGDWEGRTILALTMLYKATQKEEDKKEILDQLDEIFLHIENYLNKSFYFGNEVIEGEIDEQQLSGNSRYIRGLINYYLITKKERIYHYLSVIKDTFIKKVIHFFEDYPLCKREAGGVGGHLQHRIVKNWKLSSDVGCAFIFFDCLTDLYKLFKTPDLKEVCDCVFNAFCKIDYVKNEFQTHATLSFTRGTLRLYNETKDEKYLKKAINIFSDYINYGMTKDYSNLNWFNRPDTWTEPCCIVDSLICCDELFKATKDINYLHFANRIYLNAFRSSQRTNGGAGCNTCLIDQNKTLKIHLYEAYFCCTMRFAEGLNYAKNNLVLRSNNNYLIQSFECFRYFDENIELEVNGNPYIGEKVEICVEKLVKPTKIYIYSPEEKGYLKHIEISRLGVYRVDVDLFLKEENGEHFYGDMVLTKKNEETIDKKETFIIENEKYTYIYNFINAKDKNEELKLIQEI